jgi:hypothetical protein
MTSTLELELLTPLDWRMLRAVRLYALLDSPDAFTSSHAEESAWSQLDWQRSLKAATWIVAREAQNVIGLAKSVTEPALPEAVMSSPPGWRPRIAGAGCYARCWMRSPT